MTQVTNMARRIVELEDGLRNAVKLSAEQADEAAKWRRKVDILETVLRDVRDMSSEENVVRFVKDALHEDLPPSLKQWER